jgi:hypothetical protein
MASAMRQLVGDANILRGSSAGTDPLIPPFTIWVNPYIGSDEFAAGSFNSFESSGTDEEKIAQKLKRLSIQQMTCGYSQFRPFKTINRAIIEAAIVTSRDYFTFSDPRAQVDCVLIRLSAGRHIVYNQPGNSVGAIAPAAWANGFTPTVNHLIAFNPDEGGVIVPRAASFNGEDLRKCVLSPDYFPTPADEAADYSNRSCILRPTPLALGGQFTFVDKIGATTSHHLLDCFAYVSQAQLNTFYNKVYTSCGTGAGLGLALMAARPTEYNTVGAFAGSPDATWDTTASASAYVFNASIRSDYGLCGIFADGDRVGGLKSLVTAQFTGVSLQKDINCWEVYDAGTWRTPVNYAELVAANPDNTRKKPSRRSWHITAINDAFIQGVSEFNVGQEGCRTDVGGEITLTNSNSSFGGCAGLSNGYKRAAFPFDKNWSVARVVVPVSPSEKVGNVRRIQLGKLASFDASPNRLTLEAGLPFDPANNAQPSILQADNYTLRANTQVWIENPTGPDYRAVLSSSAWSSVNPERILVAASPVNSATGVTADTALLVGKRVYIRRIADTRSPSERRCSLEISNTASSRIPERNFAVQTDPTRGGGAISRVLNTTSELLMVTAAGSIAGVGVRDANITIRRGAPSVSYAANTFYPAGAIVKHLGKHFQRLTTGISTGTNPVETEWGETLVHMPSDYNAEESRLNESLIITFDTDTDTSADSATLGISWSTVFTSAGTIRDIYRASSDYRGVHAFLVALGLSDANAHTALLPRTTTTRKLDPTSATDFPTAPSGGAATGRGNWAIEFRRPSVLRMYGHAWEWAGFGGYSKALPRVQQTLSTYNKFTYYFTSANGGRVVPTGSNEDGFAVSSRGLEDIETGDQLSVNNLDSPELDPPTELNNLTVNGLTVNGAVDVSGVSEIDGVSQSSAMQTTRGGFGQLAALADYLSNTASADDDAAINAAWDQIVNIPGLNALLAARGYLRVARQTVVVYWDPVNGLGSTTDRLLALQQFSETPPESVATAAKSLRYLADYIAITYQAGTVVEYRLLPGICLDIRIDFATVTYLVAWDPTANSGLGAKRFSDPLGVDFFNHVKNPTSRYNATINSVFPTRMRISSYNTFSMRPNFAPVSISSKEDITLEGIVTWDLHQSLISSEIPAGYHSGPSSASTTDGSTIESWRLGASYNDVLDTVWACAIAKQPTGDKTLQFRTAVNDSTRAAFVKSDKAVIVKNVAVGAIRPFVPLPTDTVGRQETLFIGGNGTTIGGLYIYGNTRVTGVASADALSKGALTAGAAAILRPALLAGQSFQLAVFGNPDPIVNASEMRGHSYALIGSNPDQTGVLKLQLGFAVQGKYTSGVVAPAIVPSPFTYADMAEETVSGSTDPTLTLDVPINNIFFFNYADGWDRPPSTDWKLGGPSIGTLIQGFRTTLQPGGTNAGPWFSASSWGSSRPFAGMKGKINQVNSSRIVLPGVHEKLLCRGITWVPGLNNIYGYGPQYQVQAAGPIKPDGTASTAISPWRVAGLPTETDNPGRVPRFWQPNGFGRVAGPDPAANVNVTFRTDGSNLARVTSAVSHRLVVNDVVRLANAGGALPVAFNTTTDYRVISVPTSTTFELALGIDEATITPATAGTGTHTFVMQRAVWIGCNVLTESVAAGIDVSATTGLSASQNFVI